MRQLPIAVVLFGCSFTGTWAKAATIDFEAQGGSAPAAFTGHTDSPLTIGLATFRGGQLLHNETGEIDTSAVYASTNLVSGAYSDPLTIDFTQGVSGLSLLVTNEIPDTYSVTDNHGVSVNAFVSGNTSRSFSLVDSDITQIRISSATTALWDFAIDNVSYTAATSVPEPCAWSFCGGMAGVLLWLRWRVLMAKGTGG